MCIIGNKEITRIETNRNKNLYFNETKIKFKKFWRWQEREIINIYPEITYQKFLGFGAAITESSAYNYSLLPDEKKKEFMKDYFLKMKYSLCRISIGSCDFSLSSYSYSKKKDLSDFSIERDKKYIIPFIKDAKKVNPNLQLLASPWSPPAFMKNTKILYLGGTLLKKYRQAYANYLVKFIKSYKEEGIDIQYMTIQNETNAMPIWESCLFSSRSEADFLVNYLYPTFQKNNIDTKILIYDHNKEKLYTRAKEEFSNPAANKAAAGIAFHWYSGNHFENIEICRKQFPDKLLFHTEGCFGFDKNNSYPGIFSSDIINSLNAGVNGYIDWNILLDSKGGPSHIKNHNLNSHSKLNEENTDYSKTPAYYYVGHFSGFIKPGSKRIGFSKYTSELKVTAFKNPDGNIVVVVINPNNYNKNINLCMNYKTFKDVIEKKSILTYIIKPE